jgi:hypothetical protein
VLFTGHPVPVRVDIPRIRIASSLARLQIAYAVETHLHADFLTGRRD